MSDLPTMNINCRSDEFAVVKITLEIILFRAKSRRIIHLHAHKIVIYGN